MCRAYYTLVILYIITYAHITYSRIDYKEKDNEIRDFISSFITSYDCSLQGRDTREYHQYILENTQDNYTRFEQELKKNSYTIAGRTIIIGYQEGAIPDYYLSLIKSADTIHDEFSLKTPAGWEAVPAHILGCVTGYILRDLTGNISKMCRAGHILPERIGLYDPRATLFAQHAFGDAYLVIEQARRACLVALEKKDPLEIIQVLSVIWKNLYISRVTDGLGRVIAPQDTLFSIAHAQAIINSNYSPVLSTVTVPIMLVTGPDITYPIGLFPFQSTIATVGAQAWADTFIKRVQERSLDKNHQKTAYIFSSFIDGVGKTTFLANILNKISYQDTIEKYEQSDNTSSGQAQVYELPYNAVIIDVPAYMSHSVVKPDGYVYVESQSVIWVTQELLASMHKYLNSCWEDIITRTTFKVGSPEHYYIHNCCISLGQPLSSFKHRDEWRPFEYAGVHWLINSKDRSQLRVLVPLAQAHSKGLKNIITQQMIFTEGLRFPVSYSIFMQNILDILKKYNIKNIEVVDFLSMYPRSSRETIRINYIIQQLQELFGHLFIRDHSFYRSSVNPQELYMVLKKHRSDVVRALLYEASIRAALYIIMRDYQQKNIDHIDSIVSSKQIKEQTLSIYNQHKNYITSLINEKLNTVERELADKYQCDTLLESVVLFDAQQVCSFSQWLSSLYQQVSYQKSYNNQEEQLIFSCSRYCRDKLILTDLALVIRSSWYRAITQILSWDLDEAGNLKPLLSQDYSMPVRVLIDESTDQLLVFENKKFENSHNFLSHSADLGALENSGFSSKTYMGPYCFGYRSDRIRVNRLTDIVQSYCKSKRLEGKKNCFMPTADLKNSLDRAHVWHALIHESLVEFQKLRLHNNKIFQQSNKRSYNLDILKLVIRALVTVESIMRDPRSSIMIRHNNRNDISAAAELFERITLPIYYGVSYHQRIWSNYTTVQLIGLD